MEVDGALLERMVLKKVVQEVLAPFPVACALSIK